MFLSKVKKYLKRLSSKKTVNEPMPYRSYLFEEFVKIAGQDNLINPRILEIGPKDGLDSKRLASLNPLELVMVDLPEKTAENENWLPSISCPKRYVEGNFMYMSQAEIDALGKFDLVWFTGVLYHNTEQLRFIRALYKITKAPGWLVLESATYRGPQSIREKPFVEIHYPNTYRNTTTITHMPTAAAIDAWLQMAGYKSILRSNCFKHEDLTADSQRAAFIAKKVNEDDGGIYYTKTQKNPDYRFGDSR